MGTRSIIAKEYKDGTIKAIYCHWDGYPSHNGKVLVEHYTTSAKINKLIDLGDISSLREEIGVKHPFDTYNLPVEEKSKYENMTTAYHHEASIVHNKNALVELAKNSGGEYIYLRTKTGHWLVFSCYSQEKTWVPVKVVLTNEALEKVNE
jgi:hypothetical protein